MKDLITEARALCEMATPGPWMWDANSHCKEISLHSARWPMNTVMDFVRYGMSGAAPRFGRDGIMVRADEMLKSYPGKEHHQGFDDYIDHPDAALIARSRTLIPELCDALEKAAKKNEELVRELAQLASESVERDKALARLEAEVMEACNSVRWVPVTEQLPTERGYYLAVIKRIAPDELGGNNTRAKIMLWMGEDWRYAIHFPKWINDEITETVTHWQPLPAAPEKGEYPCRDILMLTHF